MKHFGRAAAEAFAAESLPVPDLEGVLMVGRMLVQDREANLKRSGCPDLPGCLVREIQRLNVSKPGPANQAQQTRSSEGSLLIGAVGSERTCHRRLMTAFVPGGEVARCRGATGLPQAGGWLKQASGALDVTGNWPSSAGWLDGNRRSKVRAIGPSSTARPGRSWTCRRLSARRLRPCERRGTRGYRRFRTSGPDPCGHRH